MGWSDINAVFLGSALCISSSAILMTMLRESEQLLETRGRLIVGILVVEDFAAVILLTVLAGIATAEGADVRSVGTLLLKLVSFSVLAPGPRSVPGGKAGQYFQPLPVGGNPAYRRVDPVLRLGVNRRATGSIRRGRRVPHWRCLGGLPSRRGNGPDHAARSDYVRRYFLCLHWNAN